MSLENPFTPQQFYHKVVDNSAGVAHSFIGVADINKDNQPDILVFEGEDNGYIGWYEYPGFQKHIIARGNFHAERPCAADIDNDGDMDIVAFRDGACWYENPLPTKDVFTTWNEHPCGQADINIKSCFAFFI